MLQDPGMAINIVMKKNMENTSVLKDATEYIIP